MKQTTLMWPLWAGDESWFTPLFPRGCVRVSRLAMADGSYRVAVWGKDDGGMERDGLTAEDADALLAALPNPLTRAWLLARGFRRA